MEKYEYSERCSLLVCSCDLYSTAWMPFFELIKKYWKNHPRKIYLNSETMEYHDEALNIINICNGKKSTWSERLYKCLERIETEYVIFSLEDFFLVDYVKDEKIEKCLKWMENDVNISVIRLKSSSNDKLIFNEKYGEFRIADSDLPYRLETQVSIWRKKDLMSFIDFSENPWQFEEIGTERIKGCEKTFLWHYVEDESDLSMTPFPYYIGPKYGYGINWGKWLWKNKKWFKQNGIRDVKFNLLGKISKLETYLRLKYYYPVKSKKIPLFKRLAYCFFVLRVRIDRYFVEKRFKKFD